MIDPGSGFGRAPGVLDLDDLTTTVLTAVRADVMGSLQLPAGAAGHEVDCRDEVMPAPVALMRSADSLFGKCAHDAGLLERLCRVLSRH